MAYPNDFIGPPFTRELPDGRWSVIREVIPPYHTAVKWVRCLVIKNTEKEALAWIDNAGTGGTVNA